MVATEFLRPSPVQDGVTATTQWRTRRGRRTRCASRRKRPLQLQWPSKGHRLWEKGAALGHSRPAGSVQDAMVGAVAPSCTVPAGGAPRSCVADEISLEKWRSRAARIPRLSPWLMASHWQLAMD
eukprot:scaffold15440_cov139-Isochrysis_galbana.AAC.5